jgi:hypothetical protein
MKKRLIQVLIITIAMTVLTNSAVSAQDGPASKQASERIDPVSGDSKARTAIEWHKLYEKSFKAKNAKWIATVSDPVKFAKWCARDADKVDYLRRCAVLVTQAGPGGDMYTIRDLPENEARRHCHSEWWLWLEANLPAAIACLKGEKQPADLRYVVLYEMAGALRLECSKAARVAMFKAPDWFARDTELLEAAKRYFPSNQVRLTRLQFRLYAGELLSPDDIRSIRLSFLRGSAGNSLSSLASIKRLKGPTSTPLLIETDKGLITPLLPVGGRLLEDIRVFRFESVLKRPTSGGGDYFPFDPLLMLEPELVMYALGAAVYYEKAKSPSGRSCVRLRKQEKSDDTIPVRDLLKGKPVWIFNGWFQDCDYPAPSHFYPASEHMIQAYKGKIDAYVYNTPCELQRGPIFTGPPMDYAMLGTAGQVPAGYPNLSVELQAFLAKNLYMRNPYMSIGMLIDTPGYSLKHTIEDGVLDVDGRLAGFHMQSARPSLVRSPDIAGRYCKSVHAQITIARIEPIIRGVLLNGGKMPDANLDPRLTRRGVFPVLKDPEARKKLPSRYEMSRRTRVVQKVDYDKRSLVLKDKAGVSTTYVLHDKLRVARLDQDIPLTDIRVGDDVILFFYSEEGEKQGMIVQLNRPEIEVFPFDFHPGLMIHGHVEAVELKQRTSRIKWQKPDTSKMVSYNFWKKGLARTDGGPKPVLWGDGEGGMDAIEKLLAVAKSKDTLTFKLHPRGLVLRNGWVKHLEDVKVGDFISTRSGPGSYASPQIPIGDLFVSEPLP